MKKNILLITLILVCSSLTVFGQAKKLPRQEFFAAVNKNSQTFYNSTRREKVTSKVYTDGVLTWEENSITEFLQPNKKRLYSITKENGKTEIEEFIEVDKVVYQRKNNGNWIKDENGRFPMWGSIMPNPISEEFTVEDTTLDNKNVKLYRWYAVFYEYDAEKTEENKRYSENKTWIDDTGFEIRQETEQGKLVAKEVTFRKLYEYEINPKDLKIEAPIK